MEDAPDVNPNTVRHPKHTQSIGNLILPKLSEADLSRTTLNPSRALLWAHSLDKSVAHMHERTSHARSQQQACTHESKQETVATHNETQQD